MFRLGALCRNPRFDLILLSRFLIREKSNNRFLREIAARQQR